MLSTTVQYGSVSLSSSTGHCYCGPTAALWLQWQTTVTAVTVIMTVSSDMSGVQILQCCVLTCHCSWCHAVYTPIVITSCNECMNSVSYAKCWIPRVRCQVLGSKCCIPRAGWEVLNTQWQVLNTKSWMPSVGFQASKQSFWSQVFVWMMCYMLHNCATSFHNTCLNNILARG